MKISSTTDVVMLKLVDVYVKVSVISMLAGVYNQVFS